MRYSYPERPSTFVFTTLLFILSFTAALAESADVHGFRARHAWRKRALLDVTPTSPLLTSTPILPTIATSLPTNLLPTPTSLPSVSVPSPSPLTLSPPSIPTSSLPTSNPTTTSTSSDSSTPSHTSPIPTSVTSATSAPTSQTLAQTTNQGTPLSSSSSSHPSSSQLSSAASSTSGVATIGATTSIVQNSLTPGYSGLVTTTSHPTGITISSTPSSGSSSNSGFFSNTGAVAGTFTIAGLFGVAGIIGVGMMIARRHASRKYEDDMEYLEKTFDPAVNPTQGPDFVVEDVEDLSDLSHANDMMEVAVPPAAYLYPSHGVHIAHGHTANEGDGYESQDYPQGAYPPQVYGIAYPSRESYAAADAYGGMDESPGMPNPFDDVATEPPAGSQHLNQQSTSHPLAAYHNRSMDSFYGSSPTASHGHAM